MHIQKIKSKICIGALSVLLVFLSFFGICKLVKLVYADALVEVGPGVISDAPNSHKVSYGDNWSTTIYGVAGSGYSPQYTTRAMCASASKGISLGDTGTIYQHDPNTTSYEIVRSAVKIMLATDSSYNSSAYQALGNSIYSTIYNNASFRISGNSADDILFAIGHMAVSAAFNSDYGYLNSDEITAINGVINTILNWFSNNSNTEWQSYYLMNFVPDNTSKQEMTWLVGGNSGGETPPTPSGTGSVEIYKVDENYEDLTGAKFCLTTKDDADANNMSNCISVDMTNTALKTVSNLPTGVKYCVKETQAPSGYQLADWTCSGQVLTDGGTIPITVMDQPVVTQNGTITIYKLNENNQPLTGAIFWVTSTRDMPNYRLADMTNTSSYSLTVDGDTSLEWCIVEYQAPSGYVINPNYEEWNCNHYMSSNGTLTFYIQNTPEEPATSGTLTISKVDADTGTTTSSSNNATLVGAIFQVEKCSDSSGCVATSSNGWTSYSTMTIGSGFTATLTGLPIGDYRIYETTASPGYKLNTTDIRTFSITASNYNINWTSTPFENEIIKGDIHITKQRNVNDANMTLRTEAFANVSFNVYKSGDDDRPVTTIVTNSNGVARTTGKALAYGTYNIKEVSNNYNVAFDLLGTKTVTIRDDGSDVDAGTYVDELLDTPTLSTSAREASSSAENPVREVNASASVSIIDRVLYDALTTGLDYKVCGEIYVVSTSTLLTPQPVCYTWTQASGQDYVEVTFNNINTINAIGDSISIIQRLYVINGNEELLIGIHNDNLDEEDETLTVGGVGISTSVSSGRSGATKQVTPGIVTITDTITAVGLQNGNTYYLRASLVDSNGNTIGLVNGDNDNGHRITKSYTMNSATGTIVYPTMDIQFNSSVFVGKSVTVYEELYDSNMNLIASHKVLGHSDQTVSVVAPTVVTKAWRTDAVNESNSLYVNTSVGVTDVVTMTNLTPGAQYILKGEIYQINGSGSSESLGNKIATSNNVPFTVGNNTENATASVTFTLDTTELIGKKLVVYEYLYYGDAKIAEHTEIADTSQRLTVLTPVIETSAVDASDHNRVIEPESNQSIEDTVTYQNLEPGKTYYLCGILMDKNTGNVLKINGTNVSEKCESKTVGTGSSGTFEKMTFNLDASSLPGVSIVVFETLYLDNTKAKVVAEHKDIDYGNQTVKVRSKIGTSAVDKYDGDQIIGVGEGTIVDTVAYSGLEPGTYTVHGALMDIVGDNVIDTGISAEVPLTISDDDLVNGVASGEVQMTFNINTKEYAGHKLVVFEELTTSQDGTNVVVAEHKDKDDAAQTINIVEPTIQTTATDAFDEDKELTINAKATIRDRVAYSGLVADTVYTLKGVLMDKETGKVLVLGNGKEAEEVVLVFTAESDSGVVKMEFDVPTATLDDKEIVVFETLYLGGLDEGEELDDDNIIAVHEDIDDESQTVGVGHTPKTPDTGLMNNSEDRSTSKVMIWIVVIAIVPVATYFNARNRKKANREELEY